jgi:malate synthase
MRSYSLQVIKTCHRRGAHAMGGMAAQIPIKDDPDLNAAALAKVREDKIREATDGHDGTWVAHPGLVPIALEAFDRLMPQANQISKQREDVQVSSRDLLKCPQGTITEAGLRNNISVGIQYMASWLGGNGCVPIYHLMEDAATAEISRTQVWQWVHHPRGVLEDGRDITPDLFNTILKEELANLRSEMGKSAFAAGHFEKAADIFAAIILDDTLDEFLTLRAYAQLD